MDAAWSRGTLRARRLGLLPARGTVSLFELVLLLVCVGLVAVGLPQSLQDVMIQTFLWAGLALAWNVAGGYAGIILFGHAAFFGIGAYTSTILGAQYDLTPWIGMWLGAFIAAAFAAGLTLVCARLRGPFFILSTLAAAEVVRIGALNWAALTGGAEGLTILPTPSVANMVFTAKTTYAVLMLAYLIAVYAITKVLEGSRPGYYLFAVRDDEEAASAAGVNPLYCAYRRHGVERLPRPRSAARCSRNISCTSTRISRDLARAVVPIRAAAGAGRARHRDRSGARRLRHHPAVGALALLFRRLRRRPASGDLWRRPGRGDALFPGRPRRRALRAPRAPEARRDDAAQVRNLRRAFGALQAVAGVSFSVRAGELLGLIGPNGAGKSTLYNLIAGALAPTTGEIVFKGRPVAGWKPYEAARAGIARTFQIPKPYRHLSVIENVALSAMRHQRSVTAARRSAAVVLADVGLADYAEAPVGILTVGLLKRLEVARALALQPSLVLFDEIMAGLMLSEVRGMTDLVAALPARGITVIWVEHVLYAIMKTAPRIIVLNRGAVIADGPPAELARDPAVIKAYLGEEMSLA